MKIIKRIIAAVVAASLFCSLTLIISGCSKKVGEKDEYTVIAEYEEGGTLKVSSSVIVHAKESGTNEVRFNIYPNAYRADAKITPLKEGDVSGSFSLTKVLFNDSAAEYELCGADENVLAVKTDRAYGEGESFNVTVCYEAKLSDSDERLSFGEDWANLGNLVPMLCAYRGKRFVECEFGAMGDPFVSEVADFKVSLTVPSEYVVASGFEATGCDVEDDKTMYNYCAISVRDVAFSINKNYSVAEKKWGDKSIKYYFYNDKKSEETLDVAIDALDYFSKNFGDYPYPVFAFAESRFDAGGMEYPCFTLVADNLSREDYLFAVVHETAHQWWYGLVGNDQIESPFLDESLAEYSTLAFFSDRADYGIDAEAIYRATKTGCAYADRAFASLYPDYIGAVGRGLHEFKGQYDYVISVYSTGMLMMKAAEEAIGKKSLMRKLKSYSSKYAYSIAEEGDFLESMGAAKPVIESYLKGKVILPIEG